MDAPRPEHPGLLEELKRTWKEGSPMTPDLDRYLERLVKKWYAEEDFKRWAEMSDVSALRDMRDRLGRFQGQVHMRKTQRRVQSDNLTFSKIFDPLLIPEARRGAAKEWVEAYIVWSRGIADRIINIWETHLLDKLAQRARKRARVIEATLARREA